MSRTATPAARAELERLVHDYRHMREAHRQARRGSRVRRRLGARVHATELCFERVLAVLPLEEADRDAWRARLHDNAPEPSLPTSDEPLVRAQGASVPWPGGPGVPVAVHLSGVPSEVRADAERLLLRLAQTAPRPVLHARASVERHADPALQRPIEAKAVLDLGAHTVRAHAEGATPADALDALEDRARRGLLEWSEREDAVRRGRAR